MSREIKFRAWYTSLNLMRIPTELIQPNDETVSAGYLDGSGCPKYSECILMQYTGLKDRNGKEIYEGGCH